MANKIFMKKLFLLFLFLTTVTVTACNLSEEQVSKIMNQMTRDYLSRNKLIHISISEPKGWKLGPGNIDQIMSDFPFVESIWDFAILSHSSSRSTIFVSYKPILGVTYFSGDAKKVAEWFREAHLKIYKGYKVKWVEVVDGSVDLYTREIGSKPFYVIKSEIFNNLLKEKRAVYIFLYIPEDIKSLLIFCFSTPAKKEIEEERPFQDFLALVGGFKAKQLDPYDEALYRNSAKLWMHNYEYGNHMDANWYKVVVEESIEELKKAATLRPNGWEPHYLLMMEYQSINADAAIEEFKYLIKLNPNFKHISKWIFGRWSEPNLTLVYRRIGKMLSELKRYDEAITYLKEGVKKVPSDSFLAGDLEGIYRQRAKARAQKEDYDGAIQDYKSLMAVKGYPYNEEIQYEDYRDLAEFYVKNDMKKEALEAYSKALEIVRQGKSFSGIRKANTINGLEARIKELQSQ